ncbi:MAG: glycerophosphodiester phosphodiesterase [Clostridia bacterium]|nr:glycerophosphodiester phosphodiesterase [Clostridia bacterium]
MKKMMSCILACLMIAAMAVLPVQAETAVPTGYVTDNLVLFLDANNNTGNGYDADATDWVDLSDATGATKVSTNGNTWGTTERCLDMNGYIKLPEKVRQAISGDNWTVEFVMEDYPETASASNIRNVMALTGDDAWIASSTTKGSTPNDNFVIFQSANTSNLRLKMMGASTGRVISGSYFGPSNATAVNGTTTAIAFDKNNNRIGWYFDGKASSLVSFYVQDTVKADGFIVNGTYQTERKPQVIFGAATDRVASREFIGKVKAIRVYSDALTDAEKAQNAALDRTRYKVDDDDGYLKDNLVLHLDANNNTGNGFDANATSWTDLSDPTGNTKVDLNGNSWGKDEGYLDSYYLDVNGYIKLPDKVRQAISGKEWTVEFILDSYPTGTTSNIRNILALTGDDEWIASTKTKGSTPNDNFVIFQSANAKTLRLKMMGASGAIFNYFGVDDTASLEQTTNTITFHHDKKQAAWYQNGTAKYVSGFLRQDTAKTDGFIVNGTYQTERKPQVIFGAATDTVASREFMAKVRAIRVYSDVLTADEMKINAGADAGNFYSEDGSTHRHSYATEYSQNETSHWYACTKEDCVSAPSELKEFGDHVYDGSDDYICNVCDYTRSTKITESYEVDIYEPDTDIKTAPIVMQTANAATSDVSSEAKRPSALIFDVKAENGVLYAYDGDEKLGEFTALYKKNGSKANMGARISDMATAEALAEWVGRDRIGNLWVISNDVEQLVTVSSPSKLDLSDRTITTAGNPVKARYLRVVSDTKYLGCSEFDVTGKTESGETIDLLHDANGNLRTGVVLSHSGTIYDNGATIDWIANGNEEDRTYIGGETGKTYFQIDLGSEQNVTGITYKIIDDAKWNHFRYQDFKIVLSNDPAFLTGVTTVMNIGKLGTENTPENFPLYFKVDLSGTGTGYAGDMKITPYMSNLVRGIVDFTGKTVRGPGRISYDFGTDAEDILDEPVGGAFANKTQQNFEYVTYSAGDKETVYEAMSWDEIYDVMYSRGYRNALIPAHVLTKEHVHSLQGSLVNVIAQTDATTEKEFYDLITTGVNGILSSDYKTNIAALESDVFNAGGESILVRGGSVVGHRGDMGNHDLYPENSVEAIVAGAQSGADSVEFDVYMTMDGYLILMHNNNISGFFDYPEDYTGTRVDSKVTITQRYWKGDLEYLQSTYNPEIGMQQLWQLYEAVDTEYPELRLHHEIKDFRTETFNRLTYVMEQYGMRSRSDIVCYNKDIIRYANEMGISAQFLNLAEGEIVTKDSVNRRYETEALYRPINSTWHTMWQYIDTEYLEDLKHFGLSAYPWATYTEEVMDGYYVQGYQGFTTDIVHDTDDYVKEIVPSVDPLSGKVTAKAYTLSHHTKKGTFDESSVVVEKWWIADGTSRADTEYDLADFEIVAVAGQPVIDQTNKTVSGGAGDVIAIRSKQALNGASYYVYSDGFDLGDCKEGSLKIDTEKHTVTVSANADSFTEGIAVVAIYRDKELLGAKTVGLSEAADISETFSYSGNAPDIAKIIFVKDLKNVVPMREAIVLK